MKKNAETGLCGDFAAVKRAWAHGRLGIADRAVAGGTSPAGTQACVLGLILERVDRRTMAILPGCVPRMEDLSAGYYSDKTTMLALRALEETRLVQVQRHGKVVIGIAITPDAVALASATATDRNPLLRRQRLQIASVAATDSFRSGYKSEASQPERESVATTSENLSRLQVESVAATSSLPYRSPHVPHLDPHDPPNPQRGDGPTTSRTPESVATTKAIPSPTVEVVAPPPAFTLTPPEPVAAKTAPKRAKTTTEPQKPTTAPTMPEDAPALPAKASPATKAPKGRKPPEERSDARYLRAFDAGIAKGAGIPAFATPPHGLTRQTLIAIAKTHAVKDGEPITGEDLLAWFEARAAAFRKYAADVPDLKFNGGWSPKGLLWWLNGGCLGEPKPPKPPRPWPPAAIDAPDWEMPESAKGKTLEQLIAEVGKPRPLHGPMPEDELQFLREAQARGQAKYKAMREEIAARQAAAEVPS